MMNKDFRLSRQKTTQVEELLFYWARQSLFFFLVGEEPLFFGPESEKKH